MTGITAYGSFFRTRGLSAQWDIIFNAANPILPAYLSMGGNGGPTFSTVVHLCNAGKEYRIRQWDLPLRGWTVNTAGMKPSATQKLRDFFVNRGGRYSTFLFADPIDYSVRKQRIGTGDGHTTVFQAIRTYTLSG